jgi:Family of unknown function (DUF5686)/CarboxypepD_reg-like domain
MEIMRTRPKQIDGCTLYSYRMRFLALLRFYVIALGFSLLTQVALGQVSGTVRDAETGDSLAFAYVVRLGTQAGCFSGLDGQFQLPFVAPHDSLKISLLGYTPQTLAVSPGAFLKVMLVPGGVHLADVLIQPTENPALRIMRNAVDRRHDNDPLNFSDFSFDTYNKLTASPRYPSSIPDSSRLDIHLFLSETVTHRQQKGPGKVQEKIISARLAGYPGKVIPFTASDLQDLSFYSNYIGVFGQQYLSPVSSPGLHNYIFSLRDTLLSGEDSIFTIDFAPKVDHFDGFKGNLRIHSHDWALLTVEVKLVSNEGGLLIESGEIKQVNTQLETGQWVPSELFTEINTKPASKNDPFRFHFSGYSRISNQQFGDSLRMRFRPEDALVVADGAGMEDSTLQSSRSIPLDFKDERSYRKLDSIGRKLGLSKMGNQVWKLRDGSLGLGVLDLQLDRIATQNRVEKMRLGVGLNTNEQMSKRFSLGGFVAWGFADGETKFGALLRITPWGDDRLYAGASYSQDLVESGFRRLGIRPERGLHQNIYREYGIRRWYLTDMEYVQSREAWIGTRLPTDLGLRLGWRQETVTPAYDYTFADTNRFHFEEAEVLLRWAPGARYIKNGSHRLLNSNNAPIFHLRYTQGLETGAGDFAYRSAAMAMTHRFAAFRGGKGLITINAGWNDRSLPRSRMRVYRSNYAKRNFTDLNGAFNTMRYDEFAADMFAEGFLYLSPKLRWLRIGKRIQPQLNFAIAAAWGALYSSPNAVHALVPMRAPHHIYLEPGITLTRLLPMPKKDDNVISAWIRGIGIGVYYRVGAYSLPTIKENIAFRLSLGGI